MRIAVDVRSLLASEQTGVGTYTKELLNALIEADTTTEWVLFSNARTLPAPYYSTNPRVTICHSRFPNIFFNTLIWFKIITLDTWVEKRMQIKLDHWFSPNLHFTSLADTPYTLTIHDTTFATYPWWYTSKQRFKHWLAGAPRQITKAKYIITPSLSTARDTARYFKIPLEKISVLNPGVGQEIRAFLKFPDNEQQIKKQTLVKKYSLPENYILYLGALEPRKNIAAALAAFEAALPHLPLPYSFIIAGAHGWGNSDLFKRFSLSAAANNIKYLGYVLETEKAALIAGAGAVVYPSLYEGFGLPVLEAITLGVPIITSSRSSMFEVAGVAGAYAHPRRPVEIAEAFTTILTRSELRNKKISLGLKQSQNFSWNETAEKLLLLLK